MMQAKQQIYICWKSTTIDNTAYIESVATGKLVTFKNQSDEEYAPISVTGDKENITDNEKFNVGYGTNGDGIKDVVAFQSVSKPGYQIASANGLTVLHH